MKKYPIFFSSESKKNIFDIFLYIAEDSEEEAFNVRQKIESFCFDFLTMAPEMGRKRDSIKKGMRSFPVLSYFVFYQFTGNEIEISAIVHQSRNLENIF